MKNLKEWTTYQRFWNSYSFKHVLIQAVFIQVTERRPLKSLLPAVKTSCWEQLSCHPKQKYFRGGTSLPQNFGLDSSTLLIEKRVQVKIGLSHSKRLYYRYKEYFCSLSWRKSLGDISLFHNRSTFFQKPCFFKIVTSSAAGPRSAVRFFRWLWDRQWASEAASETALTW